MKKHFFVKEYSIHSAFENKAIPGVATVNVDFVQIEKELPEGAEIKHETVRTVIESGTFYVYGEYDVVTSALEEMVAKESIDTGELLSDSETLPSAN